MAIHEPAPQPAPGDERTIEIGPPVEDRATLDDAPRQGSVEFYFLTRAAGEAWAAIAASHKAGTGALFWISGPSGTGKTHFLNYVLAMEERAVNERVRHAIIRVGLGTAMQANDLEQWIFDALAREIGIGDTGVALWRRLHGGEALALALEQARRLGFAAISIAVDFGAVDASSCHDYLLELARAAARNRQIIFNMYVAARTTSPADAVGLQVGAQGEAETMLAALARARRVLNPQAAATLYDGADLGTFEAQAIFPFDPLCLPILRSLAGSSNRIAGIAKLVLSVIAPWREAADGFRPLLPIDLLQSAMLGRLIDDRLGGNGRAARRIAHAAAHSMEESARAREIVDSLILEHVSGARALSASQLRARLPERHHRNGKFRPGIDGLLEALDAQSGGLIVYRSQQAWFNPAAAGAPEIAAYNLALPLLRRFDSRLGEAAQPADLRTNLKRASEAMARSVEAAHRAAAVLEAALHKMHSELKPEHRLVLDHFVALAAAGPQRLIEDAAVPESRARIERAIQAYEAIKAAAEAAPRVRSMREYLRETGLTAELAREPGTEGKSADKEIAALLVECQLLFAALETGILRWEPRSFDALEIRFQKFKWNYIQLYKSGHTQWRHDSERLGLELGDAREQCAALAKLNSIAALGTPVGENIAAKVELVAARAVRCDGDEPLALEFSPRCPRCHFVLGAAVPDDEVRELSGELDRALKTRLAALSHGAIARLIKLHDRGHRLDGFLKITQAAQTGALARVLDDNLAHYLGRLLEEIKGEQREETGAYGNLRENSGEQSSTFLHSLSPRARRARQPGPSDKTPRDG